ncbi:hypothetical protein NDU88_005519 [Pleurodeles waltl]|uniref:Uncharacterized protein n=1 Tax=Pleurodeles waltl TaxID=8319 RepID=A0AAV7WC40_PLEWA|nr:hypothetical protein NDU88_005519 [Pleurodeles waltl]
MPATIQPMRQLANQQQNPINRVTCEPPSAEMGTIQPGHPRHSDWHKEKNQLPNHRTQQQEEAHSGEKEGREVEHLKCVSIRKSNGVKEVAAAEVTQVYHVMKHHISYRSLDCGFKLSEAIYSDSSIAMKASCDCTKASSITQNVLAPHGSKHMKT